MNNSVLLSAYTKKCNARATLRCCPSGFKFDMVPYICHRDGKTLIQDFFFEENTFWDTLMHIHVETKLLRLLQYSISKGTCIFGSSLQTQLVHFNRLHVTTNYNIVE